MNIDKGVQSIGTILKAVRKFNGLQQEEVATILEVTQGTVSKIEKGLMQPELGLWFKFLKAFKVTDPYCFSYGGVDLLEDSFSQLKSSTPRLIPLFDFKKDEIICTVRTIRPLYDYLMKVHAKSFEEFMSKNKISNELFYILNHPLSVSFIDTLFNYLHEIKINKITLPHLNLNFESAYNFSTISDDDVLDTFFKMLNKENATYIKYKLDLEKNIYKVGFSKKYRTILDSLKSKELIAGYSILVPLYYLKSMKISQGKAVVVREGNDEAEWVVGI